MTISVHLRNGQIKIFDGVIDIKTFDGTTYVRYYGPYSCLHCHEIPAGDVASFEFGNAIWKEANQEQADARLNRN